MQPHDEQKKRCPILQQNSISLAMERKMYETQRVRGLTCEIAIPRSISKPLRTHRVGAAASEAMFSSAFRLSAFDS